MSRAHLEAMVEQLGRELEISGLALDEHGYACLFFDETAVNLEVDENGLLFLYTNIGTIPKQDREGFYRILLEANYFFQSTGGATIGIDEAEGIVLLIMQTRSQALEYEDFRQMLENFINITDTWTRRLSEFMPETSPAPATAPRIDLPPRDGFV